MERGLYIAASGMVAEQVRQDQIANDLANSSTPGYKADRVTQRAFADLLLQQHRDRPGGRPARHGARTDRMVTDLSPQPLRETGEPLDLAIAGDGWFAVQTAQGTRYTRNGQFTRRRRRHARSTSSATPCSARTASRSRVGADGKVPAGQVGVFA